MNLTLLIIQIVVVLLHSLIGAYTARMQTVTLYLGKRITEPELEKELPRGLQDAVTPKIQDNLNIIRIIAGVTLLIFGTYIAWYVGIISLIISIFLQSFLKMFMPKNLDHYYLVIQRYLINKVADYARNNDTMRVQAGEETLEDLNEVYIDEIKGKNIQVPTFTHVNKMALGQKL